MTRDLIDRYLAAVARELPERERADIVAELRDELMSGVDAREAEEGRPLTDPEVAAVLAEVGNPLVVAGRYRKTQHLIGPQVYPFWWAAMKATLTVIAAIYVVLIVLALIGGRISIDGFGSPLVTALLAFGGVTLVFAALERFGDPAKMARWRPERLPPARVKRGSRFEMLTELGMGVVFLLWWIGLIQFSNPLAVFEVQVELAPVWRRFYWWIVAYSVVEIASNALALLRPDRAQLIRWMVVWRSLMGAAILLGVFQSAQLLVVSGSSGKAPVFVELWMRIAVGVAIAGFLGRAATEAWRMRQDEPALRAPA